jgi:hypothetical protein
MNIKALGVVALAFAFCAGSAVAQDEAKPKSKSSVRNITGCLTKSGSGDEYKLTTADGSTWELHSDSVKMADHVGHTVTARGVVTNAKLHNMKEDAKSTAVDTGVKKDDSEHGHVKVTSIKMVSESCKQ